MESSLLGGHFRMLLAYKRRTFQTIYNGSLVVYGLNPLYYGVFG